MKLKTLFDPRFKPKSNLSIYHYCNEFVLKSICENQEIWLSDINTMNDSAEFILGREMFINVLRDNKHEFNIGFRFYIINVVMSAVPNILPLIACFSKNGDLLSQWRAYADDGKGFSIGFNSKYIHDGLGVNINSVIYKEKKQYKMILDTIRGVHAIWKTNNENFSIIEEISMALSIDIAYLKNSSFFEEQEIRIIRLLVKNRERFIDVGGNSNINDIRPLNVLERIRDDSVINYVKLPMQLENDHIIDEIIIGPKNKTEIEDLKKLLLDYGLRNIKVRKSNSTYR